MYIFSLILILSSISNQFCNGYFVTVDAHAEECFFDKVEMGTKLALTFEISEGGFLDVDVKIVGPDNRIIHQGNRETNGRYTFAAHIPGVYTYCFSNKMSTMTPKVVMFNMEVGEPTKTEKEGEGEAASEHGNLDDMITQLSSTLRSVKHEQEYMGIRDRIHRSINESTNSRVVTWAFFEAMVLVIMVIGQVMYLKRFFEVRRVI